MLPLLSLAFFSSSTFKGAVSIKNIENPVFEVKKCSKDLDIFKTFSLWNYLTQLL